MYDYPNAQEPTTLWYHDHAMDHTRGHVLMGLAGFYVLEDPARSASSGCRAARSTSPLMFQRVPAEMLDQKNADQPIWTVNNTLAPYLDVTNRPYRFRFLNANDESPLQIWTTTDAEDPDSFAPQAYLQQVGTDGGLMNSVAVSPAGGPRTKLRLFPAERGDVVIDFSKVREPTTFYLQAKTPPAFVGEGSFGPDPSVETPQPIVAFRVDPTTPRPPAFAPPRRQPAPRRPDPAAQAGDGARKRTFVFDFNNLGTPPFATVNGRFFDHQRSYANPKLGATEEWTLVNKTDGYHPIHIHDIFFQVISRRDKDGNPVEQQPGDWGTGNLAWKDVFVVPPFGTMKIIGRFTDNRGRYVFHCHNLIHEDAGMMAQFDVVKAGAAGDGAHESHQGSSAMTTPAQRTRVRARARLLRERAAHRARRSRSVAAARRLAAIAAASPARSSAAARAAAAPARSPWRAGTPLSNGSCTARSTPACARWHRSTAWR